VLLNRFFRRALSDRAFFGLTHPANSITFQGYYSFGNKMNYSPQQLTIRRPRALRARGSLGASTICQIMRRCKSTAHRKKRQQTTNVFYKLPAIFIVDEC